MNSGRTIFAQLMDFVSPYEFRVCVDRYGGEYKRAVAEEIRAELKLSSLSVNSNLYSENHRTVVVDP